MPALPEQLITLDPREGSGFAAPTSDAAAPVNSPPWTPTPNPEIDKRIEAIGLNRLANASPYDPSGIGYLQSVQTGWGSAAPNAGTLAQIINDLLGPAPAATPATTPATPPAIVTSVDPLDRLIDLYAHTIAPQGAMQPQQAGSATTGPVFVPVPNGAPGDVSQFHIPSGLVILLIVGVAIAAAIYWWRHRSNVAVSV